MIRWYRNFAGPCYSGCTRTWKTAQQLPEKSGKQTQRHCSVRPALFAQTYGTFCYGNSKRRPRTYQNKTYLCRNNKQNACSPQGNFCRGSFRTRFRNNMLPQPPLRKMQSQPRRHRVNKSSSASGRNPGNNVYGPYHNHKKRLLQLS